MQVQEVMSGLDQPRLFLLIGQHCPYFRKELGPVRQLDSRTHPQYLLRDAGCLPAVRPKKDRPRNDEPAYRVFVDGAFNRVSVRSR